MNPLIVTAIISLVIGGIGVIVNVLAINNAVNKGNIENAKQTGEMLESIRGLRRDIDAFKLQMNSQQINITGLDIRLTKAEEHLTNDYTAIYEDLKPAVAELKEKIK